MTSNRRSIRDPIVVVRGDGIPRASIEGTRREPVRSEALARREDGVVRRPRLVEVRNAVDRFRGGGGDGRHLSDG